MIAGYSWIPKVKRLLSRDASYDGHFSIALLTISTARSSNAYSLSSDAAGSSASGAPAARTVRLRLKNGEQSDGNAIAVSDATATARFPPEAIYLTTLKESLPRRG